MEQNLSAPETGVGFVLTKGDGDLRVDVPARQMDVSLMLVQSEANAWADAVKGAMQQLVDDAETEDRDRAFLAVERSVKGFNGALAALVEKAYEQEVRE